jgi:hypothetical protein
MGSFMTNGHHVHEKSKSAALCGCTVFLSHKSVVIKMRGTPIMLSVHYYIIRQRPVKYGKGFYTQGGNVFTN